MCKTQQATLPGVATDTAQAPQKPAKKRKRRSRGNKYKCRGKHCRRILYGSKICSRCRHRELKMSDPMEYAYRMQRSNARKRKPRHFPEGIPFTVSREAYRAVWEKHPDKWKEKVRSLQKTGNKRSCKWEVDRIDPYKGYEEGNLRIVSKTMNIHYWYNPRVGQMELELGVITRTIEEATPDFSDVPF